MIQGRRVTLRPVEEEDLPILLRWQTDPEVWWSMDYERPFSLPQIRDEVDRARREGHPFVVWADGRPIGRIGLEAFRGRDRICSLSMYLGDRGSWSQGYAQDAVMTLAGYAFERLDLHRIEVRTLAANLHLLGVYERCGFQRDGVLPERSWKDGRWEDHVVLSVTRDAFVEARTAWETEG